MNVDALQVFIMRLFIFRKYKDVIEVGEAVVAVYEKVVHVTLESRSGVLQTERHINMFE
jgi:hypothetical protein